MQSNTKTIVNKAFYSDLPQKIKTKPSIRNNMQIRLGYDDN